MSYIEVPIYAKGGVVVAHTKVSPEDAERALAYRWSLERTKRSPKGYARAYITDRSLNKRRSIKLHRLILDIVDDGPQVEGDHINGDTLDNRRTNLRVATRQQNAQNVAAHGRSRFRGVSFDNSGRVRKPWRAQICIDGRNHRIGRFFTEEEAGQAAHEWRLLHMPFYVERTNEVLAMPC